MNAVSVDIVDVFPESDRIPARFLRKGDEVFDAVGNRYPLADDARDIARGISTKRADHTYRERWPIGQEITAVLRQDRDPLHQRIRNDVLVRLSDGSEWRVLRVTTTRPEPGIANVVYLVQSYHDARNILEISSQEFHKP